MTSPTRLLIPVRPRHGVVDHRSLRAAGLSDAAIRHHVRAGRLHAVHTRVYAVGRPELTREGRWLAAVLACGPGAALSHVPAALLWRILESGDERPHVTVPTQDGRERRPGLTVHRSATLLASDVVLLAGIPATTIERTLIDVARTRPRELFAAVRQAERLHGVDLAGLHARTAHARRDRGHARLHRLLTRYVPVEGTESELEARFLQLCVRHRLPRPASQVRIAGFRADFCWPALRLVVETDGRGTHFTTIAFTADREKDRRLQAAGYAVMRFTWGEIVHTPGAVARELRAAMDRRRRELGGQQQAET